MNGIGIQIRILGLLGVGGICSYIACGGAGSPNAALTTTPSNMTLNLEYVDSNGNDTVGVSVTAPGAAVPDLSWSVDNIPGGNESVGTLTGSGSSVTYIAPTLPGSHTITATSTSDAKKTVSAPIRVFAPSMKVSVSPDSSTVVTGSTLALTAAVTGSRHTAVTWLVDGVAGGSAASGTITGTGTTVTYTAPAVPGSHTVRANSSANPSIGSDATVQVQTAPAVAVAVSPSVSSLPISGTLALTATVSGTTTTGVTWSVDGIAGGNATVGTLSGTGNSVTYNAPATAGGHTITATSTADTTRSGASAVTVTGTTSISLTTSSSSIPAAGTASLTATVLNASNTAVTWSVDAVAGGNATVGTITGTGNVVTYTAPSAAGSHTVMATSAADTSRNAATVITVQAPVQVGLSPAVASVSAGGTTSLTATVSGTATTSVTWTVDGVANGSSTVGTLSGSGNTVTYNAPATTGQHTIVAKSTADPTRSASSVVTVVAGVGVTLTPGPTTLPIGTALSFTATVTGTTNTAVTWSVDAIAGGNSTVGTITGTGNTVTYTAPASSGSHTVLATSAADTSRSASTLVTVQPAVSVTLSLPTATVASGGTQTFTATVTGTTNTAVVWTVDTITGGNATVGTVTGTGSTVTYTAPATAGTHTLKATSSADSAKTASATITVQGPVSVSVSPTSTTVAPGATATITATATGGSTQAVTWKVDGISGGNSTVGTITGTGNTVTYTAPSAAGTHTVTATSSADTSKSASTTVTVQTAIAVTLSQASATVAIGASQAFTATVSGTTNTAVAWTVDAIAGGNATVGTVTGTGATVTYTAPATAGTHTLKATSSADSTKTASATITVPAAVTVSVNPTSTTVDTGSTATITATATGGTTQTVTWKVDGVSGGNSSVGTLTGTGNTVTYTAPLSPGSHTVTATSVANTAISASTAVTVQSPVVTVTLNPSGTATMNPSGTQVFTANVGGTTNTAVTWAVDGITGGSSSVGTISGSGSTATYTAPTTTGTHTVSATSAANTSVSASTTVTVQSSSSVSVSLAKIGPSQIKASGATLFTAMVTGSTNTAVTWSVDGVSNGNATVGSIAAPLWNYKVIYNAPSATGSHTITATSVADPSKSASVTLTVGTTTIPLSSIVQGANVKDAPYNATGNGVTDDTAAIMAAVNAVKGTGKSVVIPAGTYMINPTVNSGAGIRLGSNMTLILQTGAVLQAMYTSTLNYQVVTASGVSNVNIYGGSIRGNNGNNSIPTPTTAENGNCIQISGSQNVVVENVATSNCFCDGIYISNQSDNITVVDSSGNSCRRNGMSIVYATNILVTGSTFNSNTGSIEVTGQPLINGSGVDVEPNANQSVVTVLFSRCTFSNNASTGITWGIGLSSAVTKDIFVDGCSASGNDMGLNGELTDGSAVTNNVVSNNDSFGIYLHDAMFNTVVKNNTVTGTGSGGDGAGIEIYNDTGTLLNGNTSTGNSRYGILSATSTNPTITNNVLTGNGTAGLRISGSTGVTNSGNTQ